MGLLKLLKGLLMNKSETTEGGDKRREAEDIALARVIMTHPKFAWKSGMADREGYVYNIPQDRSDNEAFASRADRSAAVCVAERPCSQTVKEAGPPDLLDVRHPAGWVYALQWAADENAHASLNADGSVVEASGGNFIDWETPWHCLRSLWAATAPEGWGPPAAPPSRPKLDPDADPGSWL